MRWVVEVEILKMLMSVTETAIMAMAWYNVNKKEHAAEKSGWSCFKLATEEKRDLMIMNFTTYRFLWNLG